jgi:hypothetical protein
MQRTVTYAKISDLSAMGAEHGARGAGSAGGSAMGRGDWAGRSAMGRGDWAGRRAGTGGERR